MIDRSGFTLVELTVVLLVLGLTLAVVTPVVLPHDTGPQPLDETLSLLRSARATALTRARIVEVTIDPQGGRAWLRALDPTVGLDTARLLGDFDATGRGAPGARARFRFHPDGSAWGDTVYAQRSGRTWRLYVDARSGLPARQTPDGVRELAP